MAMIKQINCQLTAKRESSKQFWISFIHFSPPRTIFFISVLIFHYSFCLPGVLLARISQQIFCSHFCLHSWTCPYQHNLILSDILARKYMRANYTEIEPGYRRNMVWFPGREIILLNTAPRSSLEPKEPLSKGDLGPFPTAMLLCREVM